MEEEKKKERAITAPGLSKLSKVKEWSSKVKEWRLSKVKE